MFRLFLDGRVQASDQLFITLEGYEGQYIIETVTHKLDYEGRDWYTDVVCVREGLDESSTESK